ncbi:MAG TPA: flavodoxin domain-containing protein [Spirochaetia bacterium]|nr:flavodoxin domain-containing protein [Spirochaetia bacterium]
MGRVLVTYYSATGGTRGAAEAIASVLSERGAAVDCATLGEARDVEGYDAFVIGAPVNGFRWRPEALAFVELHRAVLAGKPTGLFLLSIMYGLGRPSARRRALSFLDPALALLPRAKAGYFGGTMQGPAPWPLRLAFGVKKDAPLDSRDWPAIKAWAAEFAKELA